MESATLMDSVDSHEEKVNTDGDVEKPDAEDSVSVSEAEVKQNESINGHEVDTSEKRQRKKVQRLSETWNRVHVEKEEERVKAVQAVTAAFEGATGTALGEIPLIEATIRKVKPADLKLLHLIIYGRPGSVNEIRSNLRKFRGFGFQPGSEQYEKKSTYIQQRQTTDLRESLRILNLEVTGTREQLASRLLEFLHKPSADSVKYKGKIVKKQGRKSTSKGDGTTTKKRKSKSPKKNATTSEPSVDNSSQQDVDEPPSMSSESSESESDISSEAESVKKKRKKKTTTPTPRQKRTNKKVQQQKTPKSNAKRTKKNALNDSEDDENDGDADNDNDDNNESVPAKIQKLDSKKNELNSDEEDAPLSKLTSSKATPPSDDELKKHIISLLQTVNLEETSLKVVREKVFANYPNVDLSDRKDFINSTVKEVFTSTV
uniref:SAP domain-containing protein n=1 Tax=Trichobilharzia regenti TaxID=157069 RepID=A0AA85IWU5_TRIRE|nr:unnamed protein product [Trichobilharzia regenti]